MQDRSIAGWSHLGTVFPSIALAAVVVFGATPAGALEDLTGHYEGKAACTIIGAGIRGTEKLPASVSISHDPADGQVFATFEVGAARSTARGYALAPTEKPDRGVLNLLSCGFDTNALEGWFIHADVKTKGGSDSATIKGAMYGMFDGDQAGACKLRLSRIDTGPPALIICR